MRKSGTTRGVSRVDPCPGEPAVVHLSTGDGEERGHEASKLSAMLGEIAFVEEGGFEKGDGGEEGVFS